MFLFLDCVFGCLVFVGKIEFWEKGLCKFPKFFSLGMVMGNFVDRECFIFNFILDCVFGCLVFVNLLLINWFINWIFLGLTFLYFFFVLSDKVRGMGEDGVLEPYCD